MGGSSDEGCPGHCIGRFVATENISSMATVKTKSVWFCKECGNESPKWMGRCPACGEWNTMVEEGRSGDYRAWLWAQANAACRYKFIC